MRCKSGHDTLINSLIGNRAYRYCNYCTCRGIWNSSVYCPFSLPLDPPTSIDRTKWEDYDQENLPIRDDQTFRLDAKHIEETGHKEAIDHTGIAGLAILARLPSIDFPRSFPPDSMHLFFENIIPSLVRHYRGIFFKKDNTSDRATGTARVNNQGQTGQQARTVRQGRSALSCRSAAAHGAASRADTSGGLGQGVVGGSNLPLQTGNLKFKKTSDPWNISPKVWERIGRDQKVCNIVEIAQLVTYWHLPATTTACRSVDFIDHPAIMFIL